MSVCLYNAHKVEVNYLDGQTSTFTLFIYVYAFDQKHTAKPHFA